MVRQEPKTREDKGRQGEALSSTVDREVIAARIVKFTEDNNLKIHPGQEPLKWADLVITKGGCPCVPGRNECPCSLAIDDIKELNRCRCGLLVNGAYIKEYNQLTAQLKGERKWSRKPKGSFSKKSA